MFAEIRTSKRALDIISRFEAVSSRPALKEALHKCMLTAFSRYSLELEEVQATYEKHKVIDNSLIYCLCLDFKQFSLVMTGFSPLVEECPTHCRCGVMGETAAKESRRANGSVPE